MAEIILHHYDLSPFSEKVRRVLAYKALPWRAVDQPIMAPKPDLTPLTGGYRRIPVLQLGADIYCDTALILRRLEDLHPQPSVIPAALAGRISMIEDWADHRVFMQAVPPVLEALLDVLPPGFIEDRQDMTPGFAKQALLDAAPHAQAQLEHTLDYLDGQLGASVYLLGDDFTLADAACFHIVNFLKNNPALISLIDTRPRLAAWFKRIEDFGPGKFAPMSGADALAVARTDTPQDVEGESVTNAGYAPGDEVTIIADDYGKETTSGKVVRVLVNQVTVVRVDPELGDLAVHYPRAGYKVVLK